MTGWRVTRALSRVLNVVVLVVSGVYLLLYLYRWEWNRAVISGIFFVAAEIALATSLLLDALRRRVPGAERAVATTITTANNARRREPFAWLARNERLGVFVPVLLGAGVLLSAFGYVVERVAGALAGGAVDRRSARLVAVDLPLGRRASAPPAALREAGPARMLRTIAALGALALLAVAAIDQIGDATQSRTTANEATFGATVVHLEVKQKRLDRPVIELAEALWVSCRSVAPEGATLERIEHTSANAVQLVVRPALGELRRRRVFGCFEDATIERVSVAVTGWRPR
jgi:hypothetical protein